MAEQTNDTEVNEKAEVAATETKKATPKKTTRKRKATKKTGIPTSKASKAETIKFDDGTKVTLVFPGTVMAQQRVYDPALSQQGQTMDSVLFQNFMDLVITDPDMDWSYFDEKVPEDHKNDTVEVTDDDGTKHVYRLTFPGVLTMLQMRDQATDAFGRVLGMEYNTGILQNIVENKDVHGLEYFDHHNGYSEIISKGNDMLYQWALDTNIYMDMQKVSDFMDRMFR